MADNLTLRDLANQKGYKIAYDNNTKNISVNNPETGKTISFQSGQGIEYGMGGLTNGTNHVIDSNKLVSSLAIPKDNSSVSN